MTYSMIIDVYVKLVCEYISLMEQSEILKQVKDKQNIIFCGFNAINHIFKINLVSTRNIQTTYYYCEKAGYCYLEYIEQINKTDILTNLNISDVVSFVYKETILHNNEHLTTLSTNQCSDTFTNINILVNEELDKALHKIIFISNILLNWNQENILLADQAVICKNFLSKYILFFMNSQQYDILIEYFATILEKVKMKKDVLFEFIEVFLKYIVFLHKKNKIPSEMDIRLKMIAFHSNYDDFHFESPIKGVVKTLLL